MWIFLESLRAFCNMQCVTECVWAQFSHLLAEQGLFEHPRFGRLGCGRNAVSATSRRKRPSGKISCSVSAVVLQHGRAAMTDSRRPFHAFAGHKCHKPKGKRSTRPRARASRRRERTGSTSSCGRAAAFGSDALENHEPPGVEGPALRGQGGSSEPKLA